MLRAALAVVAFCCLSAAALAQTDKKGDSPKGKDDGTKSSSKEPIKAGEPVKEPPKAKTPIDQMRLPNNAIIVVVEDLLKSGSLIPKQWVVPFEEWLALQERLQKLEQQRIGDRVLPSSCKLVAELKGEFLNFTAEYLFATGAVRTMVPLGLQGGHLLKEPLLNKQPAILEFDKDEGYVVRVDKEGSPHRLVVEFRVPVKKAAGAERSIDLGLPVSAGAFLDLKLPAGVKELRWNGTPEKPVSAGRWNIGLERHKSLNLTWREPAPPSAGAALLKMESQVRVDVDATNVTIWTDLYLEDSGPKVEEWHLHFPGTVKVESVKGPPGATFKLEEKTGSAVLQVPATSDRWQVTLSQRIPRPNTGIKLTLTPVQVLGAFQQMGMPQSVGALHHGTINVKMPVDANLGQRIVHKPAPGVTQTKNTETEAAFEYTLPPATEKVIKSPASVKAPLELEWRLEKNQLRTKTEHLLKTRSQGGGIEIEVTSRIQVSALFATIHALDIRLPLSRPFEPALVGSVAPAVAFPGSLPWFAMWRSFNMPTTQAQAEDYAISDESGGILKLAPQDASGRTRVLWSRSNAKDVTLTIKSIVKVPASNPRIRLELPRPLGTLDRGGKVTIQSDDRIELLQGSEGAEEPVPERHQFEMATDQAPSVVDLAWRPFQPEIIAQSVIDVEVHEQSAQIHQHLRFPRDRATLGSAAKRPLVALKLASDIDKVTILAGGEVVSRDRTRDILWVRTDTDTDETVDLKLQFDLPMADKQIKVAPVLPAHGSHEDAKVRVWTATGVHARLTPGLIQRRLWKERGIELVRDRDHFPSMVLVGYGPHLPLELDIQDDAGPNLAAFVADRALIQVRTAEDGSQPHLARYWVHTINAPFIDVELPLPLSRFREPPTIFLGDHALRQWKKLDASEKILRIQLHPEQAKLPASLEIAYTIPADTLERVGFWSTTLQAPVFKSDVLITQMRWQLTTPSPMIAVSLDHNVRTEMQWTFQGWLFTPESTGVDGESWLSGKDQDASANPATFGFAHVSLQPEAVYHFSRPWWLLGCSGVFLVLTLGAYFSPLPRWCFWFLLAALCAGMLFFAVAYPGAWHAVAFGMQPGVVLFLAFVGVHWTLQERYRRQLIFLPSFARAKAGSTITRTRAKRTRESSTVDAPPGASAAPSTSSETPAAS